MNATPAPSATTAFERLAFRTLPLACMLLLAIAATADGGRWTQRWAAAPWIVSLFLVGLPHGAADLAVTLRLRGPTATVRLFAAYTACMAAVLVLLVVAPALVVVLFAAVSVWHFGLSHADGQSPPIEAAPWPRAIAAIARGAAALGPSLAIWPAETAAVAADLVALVERRGAVAAAPPHHFDPTVVRAVGIGLVAAAVAAVAVEAIAGRGLPAIRRRSAETVVDLLVIGLLGISAAPLFAVGCSFLAWHSWRHMRLLAPVVAGLRPADAPALVRAVARIHVAALPLLVPTWGALLACWWTLSPTRSLHDLAILSLAVYLVVTPSHDLLMKLLQGRSPDDSPALPHSPPASRSCAARSACCPS